MYTDNQIMMTIFLAFIVGFGPGIEYLLFWLFSRVSSKPTNQRSSFCFYVNWELGGNLDCLICDKDGLPISFPGKVDGLRSP